MLAHVVKHAHHRDEGVRMIAGRGDTWGRAATCVLRQKGQDLPHAPLHALWRVPRS